MNTTAKVLKSDRPRKPWMVQHRAHVWFFKTYDAAVKFAAKLTD